ncbi:hypothetical protein J6590_013341 [Homalodisca vitripennis]|nr:hypothetical protein J6590_013341 [Homalodisca vitripennis]
MGDINVDGLNHDYRNRKLKDMLASHNINRIDLPPTRVTLNTESSIDFGCSNLGKSKIGTDLVVTGLSDHIAQLSTNEESERLRKSFLRALEMERTTGYDDHKIETADRKKEYDLYLKKLRKQSTSDFIDNSNDKQRAIWQAINYKRCKNSRRDESLKLVINEEQIKNPNEIAEYLKQYFTKIADITLCNAGQAVNNQLPTCKDYGEIPDFILYPTTPEEVSHTLSSLKSKPSAGIDELTSTLQG